MFIYKIVSLFLLNLIIWKRKLIYEYLSDYFNVSYDKANINNNNYTLLSISIALIIIATYAKSEILLLISL